MQRDGAIVMSAIARPESSGPRATLAAIPGRAPRIGVLYPSGAGNLGDEAILQATFEALRARWPDAVLRAFTLHPAKTAANHAVEAEPLTGVNRRLFGAPRPDGPFAVRAAAALARRTRRIPIVGNATGWASQWTSAIIFEAASLRRAWQWLQTADLLLASGGGQLDAVWGGTWGQPYALARWAWLARRARVPFAFLSVGYGATPTRLSRRLLRYAVSQAAYCSVRDTGSRSLTRQLGVTSELPVVPDLAFALRPGTPLRARRPGYDIGISPMVYMRPGSWPKENLAEYQRYVALWADLAVDRVARGDRVHLFVTDPADMDAVHDVWARLDENSRAGCSIVQANTPDSLLDFFRRLDMVVSSRLHGVLIAIVAGRPVLALSHERKVRALMNDAGVAPFCADLTTATMSQVGERMSDLTGQLEPCAQRLRDYVAVVSAAVRKQEEMLPQLLRHR
jgi:polysaccharide pyruvyl transferase WcaK-like protein